MTTFDIFIQVLTMFGGLGLFLYGMNMLGNNLERISGGNLEKFLEKITSNIFLGVLVGALVTAAIQSSSATTVIVVGLVNAKILKLKSAIGVIMGANIGTTVTSQILRLMDLESNDNVSVVLEFIKPTTFTPIIILAGIILYMSTKNKKRKIIAEIMLGFGILFNGMFIMTDAISPLKDLEIFSTIFETLTNPVLGVAVGAIVTAILQSSSASVGILQALASTGAITYSSAFPIIMGQNIGTCVTSLLSSIGASVNARRAAMVHLYFNVLGTVVFLSAVYIIQYTVGFSFWGDPIDTAGIANFHTLFNIVVTLALIPFAGLLEKLAISTVSSKQDKSQSSHEDMLESMSGLDDRFINVSPSLAISKCSDVVVCMGEYAKLNFVESFEMFKKYDDKKVDIIHQRENTIDKMEDKLNSYLLKLSESDLSDLESKHITQLIKLLTEFERIGDYAINLIELAENLSDKKMKFSDKAYQELGIVYSAVEEAIEMAVECYKNTDLAIAARIEPLEETVDLMQDGLKNKHIERLKNGKCAIESGLTFLDVLTNVERISDHCSNIGVYVIGYEYNFDNMNKHEYIRTLHDSQSDSYTLALDAYNNRYVSKLNI
ncbi:MAG: Na/Pi cotransporter family protein [Clostridia bacterium]